MGIADIIAHEGVVLNPYKDSKGIWTWLVGHTAMAGLPDPAKNIGETASLVLALKVFKRDIERFEARVRAAFKRPLNQAQFDAAVSFDFNTGGIDRATWVKHFNNGDMAAARKSFMNWRKPKEIIPRRKKEQALFFDGVYSNNGQAPIYTATTDGRVEWRKGRLTNIADLLVDAPMPKNKPLIKPANKGGIITGALAAAAMAVIMLAQDIIDWIQGLF